MRLSLLLVAVCFLVVACGGGDEYTNNKKGPAVEGDGKTPPSTSGGGSTPGKTPPTKPPAPKANPLTAEITGAYKLAKQSGSIAKQRATELANKFSARNPTGDALYYYGLLWQIAEDHEKAAKAFQDFIAQCPGDLNFKWGLYQAATELLALEKLDEAAGFVTRFKTEFPGDVKSLKVLGRTAGDALMLAGKFDKAVDMYQAGVDGGSAYAGEEMVAAMCAAGMWDEARTQADALAAAGGSEAKRYEALAKRTRAMNNPAPELAVLGWTGEDGFNPKSLDGKVRLVYFWSMREWTKSEIMQEKVGKLLDKYGDEGLAVLGLSPYAEYDPVEGKQRPGMTPEEEMKALETWSRHFSVRWPLGLCADKANHDAFGYRGLPSLALIDAKGRYRFFRSGKGDTTWAMVAVMIEKLLDEKK